MKRFILSTFVMASFGAYVLFQSTSNLGTPNIATVPTTTKKNTKPVAVAPVPAPVKNNLISKPKGLYTDGEYIGDSIDAYYGYVQVKAVITNGRLTDVVFLDYPRDRSTSIRINSRAMPILKQEAIAAQSASVNGVSGASETSPAFRKSLASALAKAKSL